MEAIYNSEGRVVRNGGNWEFEYFLRDHLGSNRVVFKEGVDGLEVLQETHSYPFGAPMKGKWNDIQPSVNQDYSYNGKERNREYNLGWQDFGNRWMMDSWLPVFSGVDPIGEQFAHLSVYNYASNDPILNIDLHGLQGVSSNEINFDLNSTFFLQYEGRAALGITGSQAIGIMFDTQENAGLFSTTSFGGGCAVGVNSGWVGGGATADQITELEGFGFNGGLYATAGMVVGIKGAIELNIAYGSEYAQSETIADVYNNIDAGISAGVPIQIGVFGAGVGGYIDVSYTEILEVGNLLDLTNAFIQSIQDKFGVELSTEQQQQLSDYLSQQIEITDDNCVDECVSDQ